MVGGVNQHGSLNRCRRLRVETCSRLRNLLLLEGYEQLLDEQLLTQLTGLVYRLKGAVFGKRRPYVLKTIFLSD